MSELFRLASLYRGAVKKTEAEDLIVALAARVPGEVNDLAKLLALLKPPTVVPKTAEAWVAKAAAKKDVRKYLQWVYVNDGVMVATDGHRLHLAPSRLAPGYYDPKSMVRMFGIDTAEAEHPGKFPDYRRIIPTCNTLPLANVTVVMQQRLKQFTPCMVYMANKSVEVNIDYWEEATARCNMVGMRGPQDSILLEGPNGELSVIMPVLKPTTRKTDNATNL